MAPGKLGPLCQSQAKEISSASENLQLVTEQIK